MISASASPPSSPAASPASAGDAAVDAAGDAAATAVPPEELFFAPAAYGPGAYRPGPSSSPPARFEITWDGDAAVAVAGAMADAVAAAGGFRRGEGGTTAGVGGGNSLLAAPLLESPDPSALATATKYKTACADTRARLASPGALMGSL